MEGKPAKFTENVTPVPLAFVVPLMEPVMVEPVALSKLVDGRVAWYEAAGRPLWTDALPPRPATTVSPWPCSRRGTSDEYLYIR